MALPVEKRPSALKYMGYDNSGSGLTAEFAQDAIDELSTAIDNLSADNNFLLVGRVNAAGSIILTNSPIGATYSVSNPATGIMDITLIGIAVTNVHIEVIYRGDQTNRLHAPQIADRLLSTGYGTTSGFRVTSSQQIGAGASDVDVDFSFKVIELP